MYSATRIFRLKSLFESGLELVFTKLQRDVMNKDGFN